MIGTSDQSCWLAMATACKILLTLSWEVLQLQSLLDGQKYCNSFCCDQYLWFAEAR